MFSDSSDHESPYKNIHRVHGPQLFRESFEPLCEVIQLFINITTCTDIKMTNIQYSLCTREESGAEASFAGHNLLSQPSHKSD